MLATILIALAALGATSPGDDVISVQAEGTAVGTGAAAKREATANAQLAAIVDCVERLAPGKDLNPFKSILDAAPDYIRSSRRTDLDVGEEDTTVTINARILNGLLQRDAARILLRRLPQDTKVLVLVAERIGKERALGLVPAGEAEIALGDWLREAGLDVVNPVTVRARRSEAELLEMLRGNDKVGGKLLAREHLAQVAVLGMCTVDGGTETQGTGLPTNRARLELRIIEANEGAVLDTLSTESVLHSVDAAHGAMLSIQDACERLRNGLLTSTVLAAATNPPKGGVIMTIEGADDSGRVDAIIDALATVPGVENLEEVYRAKGTAQFRVEYGGKMAAFVKAITGRAYQGFRVETRRAVGRDLRVRIVQ